MRFHRVAKDFEVARPHVAGELLDDVIVWVGDPLAHFVRNHRHVDVDERWTVVTAEPGRLAPKHLRADALDGQIVRAFGEIWHFSFGMAGATRVEPPRVFFAIMCDP